MQAQVLSAPPVSGSIPERGYDATGSCVWVRFEDAKGGEWTGVFGASGLTGSASVTLFEDGRSALVIARGQGYIVDTESGELRHKTECDYLVDVLAIPARGLVVACDFTMLLAYSPGGLVWRSARVAVDGIRLESATPEELRGSIWDGNDWQPFRLAIGTWSFREGPWHIWRGLSGGMGQESRRADP
jgi:hypothetical protein